MSQAWAKGPGFSSTPAGDLLAAPGEGTGGFGLTLWAHAADAGRARGAACQLLMHGSPQITLAIAHFEDLLARGLRVVIDSDPSLQIVADDVQQDRVEVILRAHRPTVAILDVDALTNLAEVRQLSRQHPDTRLVLLTRLPTTAECAQLLAFGASACLGRDTQARDVLSAIHLASRGLQLIPRGTREPGAGPPQGSHLLTQREAELLPMLQQGSSNAQIAFALGVGVETVRTHARNIYRKLGVSSRRELEKLPPRPSLQDEAASGVHPERRRGNRARDRPRRPRSVLR
jgi:DNA-binding NarL/FixJ family response regulator